ncbi:MAG: hypothetical protein H6636_11300 [Anaerolineales bacterium]|nr:hypothetical protein [Anaerolineales bacterium]
MRSFSPPLLFPSSLVLLLFLTLLSACTPSSASPTPRPTPVVHLITPTPHLAISPPEPTFRIIGYVTDEIDPALIPYTQLTHLNYAFVTPNADGTFQDVAYPDKLKTIVEQAHVHGVKILISVGGWGWDAQFETLTADPASRATFVSGLVAYAAEHRLDGLDIDWEYPDPGTSAQNFLALMQDLRTALPAESLLTAAVLAEGDTATGILPAAFPLLDFVNIMAYDASNTDHSPYTYAEAAIHFWLQRGLPPEKAVLGVPFYARPNWVPYRELIAANPEAAYLDVIEYAGEKVYYNSQETMAAKTRLAMQQGSGIMIWTLSFDTFGETSLLTVIYNTVHIAP